MRKTISVRVFLLMTCGLFFISPAAICQITVGGTAGLGVTSMYRIRNSVSQGYNYDPGFGKQFSIFAGVPIGRSFALIAQAGYSMQGALTSSIHPVITPNVADIVYTECLSEMRLHFATAALLLRYEKSLRDGWSVYLQAGPAPHWLAAAEQVDKGYGNNFSSDESAVWNGHTYYDVKQNIREHYHAWNLTTEVAAGVKWKAETDYMFIAVAATRGHRAIEKYDDRGLHSTGFCYLLLGYGIDLHH